MDFIEDIFQYVNDLRGGALFKMRKNNIELEEIVSRGHGSKCAVFVHGTSFGAWCWIKHFIPFFQNMGYDTYAFSFRAHGNSKGQEFSNRWGIMDYVYDLDAIMCRTKSVSVIVAHSIGCIIVLKWLELNPDYQGQVVLLAPSDYHKIWIEYLRYFFAMIKSREKAKMYFGPDMEQYKKLFKKTEATVSIKLSFQLLSPHIISNEPVHQKILVQGSFDDKGVSYKSVIQVGKRLNAKTILYPGICHAMMLDKQWTVVAKDIQTFLEQSEEPFQKLKGQEQRICPFADSCDLKQGKERGP